MQSCVESWRDMRLRLFTVWIYIICLIANLAFSLPKIVFAQEGTDEELLEESVDEEELVPELPTPGGERETGTETELPTERLTQGGAGEGETRWGVDITGAVVMNYVFNDSSDSFTVKYRFEVKGQANANTAVIRGDVDIDADVEGPLSSWPTGECRLEITIPKVPFELTFNKRPDEERGSLKLSFKRTINEDWQSKCTFTDAPGARFDTRGSPETWLGKALEKARPPLKEVLTEIGREETTTRFVINKETINDAPLGSGEFEGTGVITITPGGE